jgi:hypothetical protein
MTSDQQAPSEKQNLLAQSSSVPLRVVVCDFDMPFVSIAWFMVKASLAAIPAAIILALIYFATAALFAGGIAALFHH